MPKTAIIDVPRWLWGGNVPDFFNLARLNASPTGDDQAELTVEAREHLTSGRPNLVTVRDLAGPTVDAEQFHLLSGLDAPSHRRTGELTSDRHLQAHLEDLFERTQTKPLTTAFAAACAAQQLLTITCAPVELPRVVQHAWQQLRDIQLESGGAAYPNASAHFVQRDPALLHRTKLAAVLLRIAHDERLRAADISALQSANAAGELVFAASATLAEGIALLDAYLAPLLGAMTPFVWAFSAPRASGTVIYALGSQIRGTDESAVEPLQLLPSRAATRTSTAPDLSQRSASAATTWWTRRLDKALSIMSDPAVYTDSTGRYSASKHLHAQLSMDQLFRRVGSIQRSHRDTDARRVLLFTVLDTLERLASRTQMEMCTLSFAKTTFERLEADMSADVAALLLPAARRAVVALEDLQSGFFLARQQGIDRVEYTDANGELQNPSLEEATAQYLRVLRNATHGHGSNRVEHKLRTDALLAHHDGHLPHDLGLLGWLYLLDLLANPANLRRTLYDGGAA